MSFGEEVSTDPVVTKQDVADVIINSGLFKQKTEYIIIGDEPQGGSGVVDLKKMLSPEQYQNLRKYFTLMPRSILWNFFMTKIFPSLPLEVEGIIKLKEVETNELYGETYPYKPFAKMVWAAMIDLFNEANLEYVNANQLEPWVWEQKKLDAYYVSTSKEAIDQLESQINSYDDVTMALDPQAKKIMEAYALLPKVGDVGLEINRQNAVKQFLKQKDYVTAQAIVDAFRYINESVLGSTLTKPIPYEIKSEDGGVVVAPSQG